MVRRGRVVSRMKDRRKWLADMLLIRRFEEKAAQMYGLQKIGGFCHLYIGQEAVAVGAIAALDLKEDYVLTGYRDHGHALACGMPPDSLMAELYGRETGCSKGKGGSMHLFDVERHMLGGNGIVGGHIPVASGVAFRIAYENGKGVVLCFFGDGAIHQGAFHESLNLAKIWSLPIVYIVENNQYGMGTDYRRVSAIENLSDMSAAYGLPGSRVDGMDVEAVYEAVSEAVERARAEHAASLLEIRTYRFKGHSMSDPGKYRTREELDAYRRQDPILILKARMIEAGEISENEYARIDRECREVAEAAAEYADNSQEPPLEALYEDVLAP